MARTGKGGSSSAGGKSAKTKSLVGQQNDGQADFAAAVAAVAVIADADSSGSLSEARIADGAVAAESCARSPSGGGGIPAANVAVFAAEVAVYEEGAAASGGDDPDGFGLSDVDSEREPVAPMPREAWPADEPYIPAPIPRASTGSALLSTAALVESSAPRVGAVAVPRVAVSAVAPRENVVLPRVEADLPRRPTGRSARAAPPSSSSSSSRSAPRRDAHPRRDAVAIPVPRRSSRFADKLLFATQVVYTAAVTDNAGFTDDFDALVLHVIALCNPNPEQMGAVCHLAALYLFGSLYSERECDVAFKSLAQSADFCELVRDVIYDYAADHDEDEGERSDYEDIEDAPLSVPPSSVSGSSRSVGILPGPMQPAFMPQFAAGAWPFQPPPPAQPSSAMAWPGQYPLGAPVQYMQPHFSQYASGAPSFWQQGAMGAGSGLADPFQGLTQALESTRAANLPSFGLADMAPIGHTGPWPTLRKIMQKYIQYEEEKAKWRLSTALLTLFSMDLRNSLSSAYPTQVPMSSWQDLELLALMMRTVLHQHGVLHESQIESVHYLEPAMRSFDWQSVGRDTCCALASAYMAAVSRWVSVYNTDRRLSAASELSESVAVAMAVDNVDHFEARMQFKSLLRQNRQQLTWAMFIKAASVAAYQVRAPSRSASGRMDVDSRLDFHKRSRSGCHTCGEPGHHQSACPTRRDRSSSRPRTRPGRGGFHRGFGRGAGGGGGRGPGGGGGGNSGGGGGRGPGGGGGGNSGGGGGAGGGPRPSVSFERRRPYQAAPAAAPTPAPAPAAAATSTYPPSSYAAPSSSYAAPSSSYAAAGSGWQRPPLPPGAPARPFRGGNAMNSSRRYSARRAGQELMWEKIFFTGNRAPVSLALSLGNKVSPRVWSGRAVMDSAATISVVNLQTANALREGGVPFQKFETWVQVADGNVFSVSERASLRVTIATFGDDPIFFNETFYVSDSLPVPALLSEVCCRRAGLISYRDGLPLHFDGTELTEGEPEPRVLPDADDGKKKHKPKIDDLFFAKQVALELLARFQHVFEAGLPGRPCHLPPVKILLREGLELCHRSNRRMHGPRLEALRQHLIELLEANIIMEKETPTGAPVLMLQKKVPEGSPPRWRMCVDLRELNEKSVPVFGYIPLQTDLISMFGKRKYFAQFDLTSAYLQMKLTDDSKDFTAFIADGRTFVYNRLPIGFAWAPAHFNRAMDRVFASILGRSADGRFTIAKFFDNICIGADTEEDLLDAVSRVLKVCEEHGLLLHPDKTEIGARSTIFMGHELSGEGIRIDPARLQALQDLAVPKDVRQLRGILGAFGYVRDFIPHFADITEPLTRLTRGNTRSLVWTAEADAAFRALKEAASKTRTLAHPDYERQLYVDTDASELAVGAVLWQHADAEETHKVAISFASKTLSEQQRRWANWERELFAVVYAFEKFRSFIQGIPVIVRSDCTGIANKSMREASSKVTRWLTTLQEQPHTLQYLPGVQNVVPDVLSRAVQLEGRLPHVDVKRKPAGKSSPHRKALGSIPEDADVDMCDDDPMDGDSMEDLLPGERRVFILRSGRDLAASAGIQKKTSTRHSYPALEAAEISRRMQLLHDGRGGHRGVEQCARAAIAEGLAWSGMRGHLDKYIKSCHICQKERSRGFPTAVPQGELSSPHPYHTFSVDFLQFNLEDGDDSKLHLFVCIEDFSRWVWTVTTARVRMVDAIAAMKHVFSVVRLPLKVRFDSGPCFQSQFTDFLASQGVEWHETTPEHHQSNGLVERVNETLQKIIRAMAQEAGLQSNWSSVVPDAVHCYNTSHHIGLGLVSTPRDVLFPPPAAYAVDAVAALSGNKRKLVEKTLPPQGEEPAAVDAAALTSAVARQVAVDSSQIQVAVRAKRRRRNGDGKAFSSFKAGDEVLLKRESRPRTKVSPRLAGPYTVKSVTANNSLVMRDSRGPGGRDLVIHSSQARLYDSSRVPAAKARSLDDDYFLVEEILAHKSTSVSGVKTTTFKVKWDGYAETTWESTKVLRRNPALTTYLEKKGLVLRGSVAQKGKE